MVIIVIIVVNEVDTIDIITMQVNIMKMATDIMSNHNSNSKLRHQENLNNHQQIIMGLIQVMEQHHQHRKQLMVVVIIIIMHRKDNERLNNLRVMVSNKEQYRETQKKNKDDIGNNIKIDLLSFMFLFFSLLVVCLFVYF
jgi:hypothetical protein